MRLYKSAEHSNSDALSVLLIVSLTLGNTRWEMLVGRYQLKVVLIIAFSGQSGYTCIAFCKSCYLDKTQLIDGESQVDQNYFQLYLEGKLYSSGRTL